MAEDESPIEVRLRGIAFLAFIQFLALITFSISALNGYVIESVSVLIGIFTVAYAMYDRRVSVVIVSSIVWFVGCFVFWAPYWRGFIYNILVKNPGVLQWMVIGAIISLTAMLLQHMKDEKKLAYTGLSVLGFIILIGGVFAGLIISDIYMKEHIANEIEGTPGLEIEELPESSVENTRIAPKSVAENWALNSLQYPRYKLSEGDITYINNTPYWSFGLIPSGTYNKLTQRQIGAVYVNQSKMTKQIRIDDTSEFKYGQGMAITDSYKWQLARHDYFKDYGDPFVVPEDGSSKLVVPYKTHDWEFRLTPVPQLYSVPEFGGVKVISEDGSIRDYTPEEAQESELLGESQNYYPYDLARLRVESMAYKNGFLNTLFGHKEQLELAEVPGQGNSQPFAIPTEDGINYFVAAEPFGESSNGIYQIWVIDAQDGDMSVLKLPKESAFRGPRKAIDSITSVPTINRLTNANAIEPIPVVKNGTLFWQVRIVPSTSARIQYIAFFNAESEDVTIVETEKDVRAFLSEERNAEVVTGSPGGDGKNDSDCAFYVNIDANSDGDLNDEGDRQVCVPEGGEVNIGNKED